MYRINDLIKLDRKIFHTGDLAILWGISNKNTLYTTIKRLVQKAVLIPIHKGLYATLPVSELDPLELGRGIIHQYTYLSTESVLAQAGVISQKTFPYTFVCSQSKRVTLGPREFLFRRLKPEYLFNPSGIAFQNGNLVASPERAAADLLYYNPHYHFDIPELLDFDSVKAIQKDVGYPC